MGEVLIADFLKRQPALQKGSLLLIASEFGLEDFPTICQHYTCIHKQQLWSPGQSKIQHASSTLVQAYIDYLLVNNAWTFYGNKHSTFTEVIMQNFGDLGKPAIHFNVPL